MRYSNILLLLVIILFAGCDFELDENIPIGNPGLKITGINPKRALRGDTLTIYGQGFNPIAYQNTVMFEVDRSAGINRIVDASPDSIKVIIPDNALTGDVKVYFGVDTVKSPEIFELISLLKRPTIQRIDPQLAAPGTKITIRIQTGLPPGELPIVLFGETFVPVEPTESILEFFVRVPSLFPGPVNLQGGIVTPEGDTLLSKPFSFGVLPGITEAPLTVWTSSSAYDVSKGELMEGAFEVEVLYPEIVAGRPRAGIAINSDNNNIYWISNNNYGLGAGSKLMRGNTDGDPAESSDLAKQFNDILIANNFIYLTGGLDDILQPGKQNIRRYALKPNGAIGSVQLLYSDASNSSIVNLKIAGENFYWCDALNKKIYQGVLNSNGTALQITNTFTSDNLLKPTAIAIGENGELFIADRTGELISDKTILWKASFAEPGNAVKLYEQATQHKINDLEIDTEGKFLYWITSEGVYRKAFDRLVPEDKSKPTPVYGSVGGNYLDF
jgi:hypothetical protein